jgi:hypothetical protein
MHANFVQAPPARRLLAVVYTGALLAVVAWTGSWTAFVVGWLIPAFPLYHMSGLLQLLTEHHWVRLDGATHGPRVVLAKLTSGRFMGEAAPSADLPPARQMLALTCWCLRMALIHGSTRLFVTQLDLPSHDWHHRFPQARRDWPNAAFARRDDEVRGCPGWPPYEEVWGIPAALNKTFTMLSQLPPKARLGAPMTSGETSEFVLGM